MKHFAWAALLVGLTAVIAAPNTAKSAVIVNFAETGGDVTMTLSGSLDISGLSIVSTGSTGNTLSPTIGLFGVGGTVDNYGPGSVTGPTSFGPGFFVVATSGSGDAFVLNGSAGSLALPTGYVSNDPLSSMLTLAGTDFATLGMIVGTYVWTLPSSDIITMNIEVASVPAPAGLPLTLAGLGAVALVRQRRKRAASV